MNREGNVLFFEEKNDDIINIFTTKPLNFKKDRITKEEYDNNIIEIEETIGYKFKKYVCPNQKHTDVVKVVTESNMDGEFDDVDGLITNVRGVALITNLADCQGILLYDKKNKVIGNIHSGWRGTLNRIVSNGINMMISDFNSDPKDIEAYICPSILKCCFEVDKDVEELFIEEFKDININELIENKNSKYYIDTVEINKRVMLKLGLDENNIHLSNICSKCNNDYIHSYRGDRPFDGRNISIICIK